MAKAETSAPSQAAEQDAGAPAPALLSLTDFCIRLSESVRRPELIGAFEFSERTAGRVKATAKVFQVRFEEFANKPV